MLLICWLIYFVFSFVSVNEVQQYFIIHMPQLEHSCSGRSKVLNLSINHHEVMACMRSSALAVSFLLQLQLGAGAAHVCTQQQGRAGPRKQGKGRCQWRPTKSASARAGRGNYSRPFLYVSKAASSAWHCTASGSLVALPFTLMVFFFLFVSYGCRCLVLVVHAYIHEEAG